MSMDKSDSSEAAGKGPSMKERLLAQRKAEADAAAKPAVDPKLAAASSKPATAAARPAPTPAAPAPKIRVGAAAAAAAANPSAAERISARRGAMHPHTELSPDVKREVQLLKERESKTMTYVWIVCGVLFLAAAGFLGNTLITQANRAAAQKAEDDKILAFKAQVLAMDPLKESDATKILALCSSPESQAIYKHTNIEGDISRAMSIAQRTIDSANDRKEMVERLDGLVKVADAADSQTLDALKSARRTRTDLMDKTANTPVDDDYKKRLVDAGEKLDRAYLTKLMNEAKAKGQTREALTAYTAAELEVRNALDNTLRGTKDVEKKKWYEELYKTLLTDSDAIAIAVFTQAVIDGEPWKDTLLSEEDWKHAPELVGFQIKDGQMHVVGPKAGGKSIGTFSVGDNRQLKDFIVQGEITPVKGNFKIYFRAYQRMDSSEFYAVNTIGKDPAFKPGQSYPIEIRCIGSTLSVKFPNTAVEPWELQVGATKQRFGSIGFAMDEDSELKLSSFKYKELRSNKRQ